VKVSRVCECGKIVKGDCEDCSKKKSVDPPDRASPSERGYDHRWRKLSERFRRDYPLCYMCRMRGKITPAMDVHHIKSVRTHPELRLEWDNLMSLCRPCHREIEECQDENH